MRVSDRLLAVAVLLIASVACDRQAVPTDSPAAGVTPRGAALATASAHYGVNAEVRYAGNGSSLGAEAKVYVFLRERGARMPLAVQYFNAGELPRRASFSARAPLTNVEVVARLSRSGRVEKSAGDPETHAWVDSDGHPPPALTLVLTDAPDAGAAVAAASERAGQVTPRTVSVHALVKLDSAAGLPTDAPVFVIARDGRNPVPLAVRKLTVGELPAEVVLSDADAMLFSHRLSDSQVFSVLARVSPDSRAERSAEDLVSAAISVDAGAVPDQIVLAIGGATLR